MSNSGMKLKIRKFEQHLAVWFKQIKMENIQLSDYRKVSTFAFHLILFFRQYINARGITITIFINIECS